MEANSREPLLDILKALADDSRLAMLRILHEQEYTVGDLAEKVRLSEPTVSHHLARLREVGLVTLRMAGNQRFYRANNGGIARFKRLVGEIEQTPRTPEVPVSDDSWIAALSWDAWDLDVLRDHTSNRQLTHIPSKQKKLLVVLRWLATLFEPDRLYTEPEVNAILKAVYEPDFVGLRRDLVDFGYLRRERGGGKYWLTPSDDSIATDS
jgi:hypothetical protein